MRYAHLFIFLIIISSCSPIHKEIRAHRETYKNDFLHDPRSPLKEADFKNLDFYPPSASAKIEAGFKLTPDAEPFDLPTYSGITRSYRKYGEASFVWQGNNAKLSIYQNMTLISNPAYNDYLFLPFKDLTNSISTYGGGRYINISKADTEDGKVTIDFNKSYNPWCAFSEGFNCPIPPAENHLPFEVRAGERQYKGAVKH
jgi:uncharacterized protein